MAPRRDAGERRVVDLRGVVAGAAIVALALVTGIAGAWWTRTDSNPSGSMTPRGSDLSGGTASDSSAFTPGPDWAATESMRRGTELARGEPTVRATAAPSRAPTQDVMASIPECREGRATPDQLCAVAIPAPPTATAVQACRPEMAPKTLCRWPSEGTPVPPTPGGPR
jgi:hypothetical protein